MPWPAQITVGAIIFRVERECLDGGGQFAGGVEDTNGDFAPGKLNPSLMSVSLVLSLYRSQLQNKRMVESQTYLRQEAA